MTTQEIKNKEVKEKNENLLEEEFFEIDENEKAVI